MKKRHLTIAAACLTALFIQPALADQASYFNNLLSQQPAYQPGSSYNKALGRSDSEVIAEKNAEIQRMMSLGTASPTTAPSDVSSTNISTGSYRSDGSSVLIGRKDTGKPAKTLAETGKSAGSLDQGKQTSAVTSGTTAATTTQKLPAEISGKGKALDGDTLYVGRALVRLDGIDAPARKKLCNRNGMLYRCGERAKEALAKLANEQTIRCKVTGTAGGGKAYAGLCFAPDKTELNKWLVANGYAQKLPDRND